MTPAGTCPAGQPLGHVRLERLTKGKRGIAPIKANPSLVPLLPPSSQGRCARLPLWLERPDRILSRKDIATGHDVFEDFPEDVNADGFLSINTRFHRAVAFDFE